MNLSNERERERERERVGGIKSLVRLEVRNG